MSIASTLLSLAIVMAASPRAFEREHAEAAVQDNAESALAVMGFNLRYETAQDDEDSWRCRRDLVVQAAAPDIIGTQEARRFQLDEIEEALLVNGEVGVGREDGREAGEFSAIFYYLARRLRVEEQGTFWFSETS